MDEHHRGAGGVAGLTRPDPANSNPLATELRDRTNNPWLDAEESAQSLLPDFSDAIFLIDAISDRILDANDAAIRYLGYSRDEMLQMHGSDLIAEDAADDRRRWREFLSEDGVNTFQVGQRRKDGRTVAAEIRVAPVEIDGRPIVHVIAQDVVARNRAAAAVYENDVRFRKIFETSAIGMTVLDRDGHFVAVNQAFAGMLGYAPDELIGRHFWDVTHLDDRSIPESRHTRALIDTEMRLYREKRYVHKDGRTIWAALTASPYHNANGEVQFQLGQVQDITERKLAEDALRESERRFRDFAGASADRFWETDEEHRFTYISTVPSDSKLHPSSNFIGKNRLEFMEIADDPEGFQKHKEDLEAIRPFRDFRIRIHDRFGKIAHLRINGTPFFDRNGRFDGYRGTVIDETPEIEARAQVESTRQRFFDALENVSEDAILWDADHCLVMCNTNYRKNNPEMASFVRPAMSHEEYLRARVRTSEVLGALDDPEAWIAARRYEFKNLDEYVREDRIDGRWLRVRGKKLADGSRLTMTMDITEEKRREEELRQAQKMEAVGRLTGGIAHDFNNMLATILGNLELAEHQIRDRPDAAGRLAKAISAVQKGATMVSRLLIFSRKQALEPAPTDINALIEDLNEFMHGTLGEQIEISLELETDLWRTLVDQNQLDNAVLNLAINARDAMPAGGKLIIKTANVTLDGSAPIDQSDVPVGDFVSLMVCDDGCGMEPEVLSNAFEPFFTTKEVGAGSGLGLSMVYGFVKQSGGHVQIESEPDSGTTVILYLPRHVEDAHSDAG